MSTKTDIHYDPETGLTTYTLWSGTRRISRMVPRGDIINSAADIQKVVLAAMEDELAELSLTHRSAAP
jgi:hypothetical protein